MDVNKILSYYGIASVCAWKMYNVGPSYLILHVKITLEV